MGNTEVKIKKYIYMKCFPIYFIVGSKENTSKLFPLNNVCAINEIDWDKIPLDW